MVIITDKKRNKLYKPSRRKFVTSFSLAVISLGLLLILLLVDPILMFMRHYTHITNGSIIHEFLTKEVEGIHVSAYLFSITNAERFMAGKDRNLKVEEVGPFTYLEYRKNEDLELDPETGVMRYTPSIRLRFLPEESVAHPEDVNVTMPNLPMLGLTSKMSTYPFLTRMSFNFLANQVNSKAIVKTDASTFLWGYKEPLVSLAHNVLPGFIDFEKMGILDRIYDKNNKNRLELSINDDDKFMIKKRNGHKKLKMSDSVNPDECEKCSSFENAYEGLGYPIGITSDFPIRIFRNGLCKILDMEFYEKRRMEYGGDALIYHFSDNFFVSNPNETSDGLLDLSECYYGIPFAMTKPHFLDIDPHIYERIEGMQPDEKHRGWITIEPKLGLQMETVFSLQMNLVLGNLNYNSEAKSFSNMVLPILYIYIEQPELPPETWVILKRIYIVCPYIIFTTQILLYFLTFLSWAYLVRLLYYKWIVYEEVLKGIHFPLTTMEKPPTVSNAEPLMTEIPHSECKQISNEEQPLMTEISLKLESPQNFDKDIVLFMIDSNGQVPLNGNMASANPDAPNGKVPLISNLTLEPGLTQS